MRVYKIIDRKTGGKIMTAPHNEDGLVWITRQLEAWRAYGQERGWDLVIQEGQAEP